MIIYKATNKINGKSYIGQTIHTLNMRKNEHLKRSKYKKYLTYFGKALQKYGESSFDWEVIDTAETQNELDEKASYWIEFYQCTDPQHGYNLKGGGEKPYLTDTVKKKIGNAQKGSLNHMYGRRGKDNPVSRKVINITTGAVYDSATECAFNEKITLSKVCATCRGERATTNYCVYRYLDEENHIIPVEVTSKKKTIAVVNIDTNERFDSIKEAQRKYDIHTQDALHQALKRGQGKCLWSGYRWRYEDIEVEDLTIIVKKVRSDAKKVINMTTGTVYPSITSVGKNYRNLATALRKGNGECIYKKDKWKIVVDESVD